MTFTAAEEEYLARLRKAPARRRRAGWVMFLVGLGLTALCFKAGLDMNANLLSATRGLSTREALTGIEVFAACKFAILQAELRFFTMAFSVMSMLGLTFILTAARPRPQEALMLKFADENADDDRDAKASSSPRDAA